MPLSSTQSLVLAAQYYSIMEPTHLSNTAPSPFMENKRGIWSALSRYLFSKTLPYRSNQPFLLRHFVFAAVSLNCHRAPWPRGNQPEQSRTSGTSCPNFAAPITWQQFQQVVIPSLNGGDTPPNNHFPATNSRKHGTK
jgi:hypothetical protein